MNDEESGHDALHLSASAIVVENSDTKPSTLSTRWPVQVSLCSSLVARHRNNLLFHCYLLFYIHMGFFYARAPLLYPVGKRITLKVFKLWFPEFLPYFKMLEICICRFF